MRGTIAPVLIAASLVGALAACTPQHEAQDAVKRLLNDPESARFTDLTTGPDGNVCGMVNAKNRMGGYVGATPFFYQTKAKYAIIVPPLEDSDFRSLWVSIKHQTSFTDELSTLSAKCMHMSQWKDVCGNFYPYRTHHLCTAMSQDGAAIYRSLKAAFE